MNGIPYTSGAKRAIASTMAEAVQMRHTEIGTGHLLVGLLSNRRRGITGVLHRLGLLRERPNIAAQAFGHFGLSLKDVRREPHELLNDMP